MSELKNWSYIARPGTNLRFLNQDTTALAVHDDYVEDEIERCERLTGGQWEAIKIPEYKRLFGE